MCNCTRDEGGPFEFGNQVLISKSPAQGAAGPKKAIMAVAASILSATYHMLKDGTQYQDLGFNHLQNRSKSQQTLRLVKRSTDLGYDVALKPQPS
jgi:hypothetical protein